MLVTLDALPEPAFDDADVPDTVEAELLWLIATGFLLIVAATAVDWDTEIGGRTGCTGTTPGIIWPRTGSRAGMMTSALQVIKCSFFIQRQVYSTQEMFSMHDSSGLD